MLFIPFRNDFEPMFLLLIAAASIYFGTVMETAFFHDYCDSPGIYYFAISRIKTDQLFTL
jgi:hypothetical protein